MTYKKMMTRDWFQARIDEGFTAFEIAEEYGCSISTVSMYFRGCGIKSPPGFWSKPGSRTGRPPGFKHAEEWKQQMSKRFSGSRNPFWGKKHTEETREKMRANHADFSGDNNPFRRALLKDPEKRRELRNRAIRIWTKRDRGELSDKLRTGHEGISGTTWARIKCGARTRDLTFNLTPKEAWELFLKQEGKCALSGVAIIIDERNGLITASLDRIDSGKGYSIENVQWVHKDINVAKMSMQNQEFIAMCIAVATNHVERWSQEL